MTTLTQAKIWLFAIALFVAVCLATAAWPWPGTVVAVHDGDTITVEREDGTQERIRLYGVDCPEQGYAGRWEAQPYSRVATDFVRRMFRQEGIVDVAIWEMGESYGRIVGGVIVLGNGKTLQEELIRAGLAWVDARHCKRSVRECRAWTELQQEAAEARRGLWRALDSRCKPVAPWIWRSKGIHND